MARTVLIKLHLYFSAFFAAAIVLVAVSGGLYLVGIKGSVDQTLVGSVDSGEALLADPSPAGVEAVLAAVGVTDFTFDYVKKSGSRLMTRPTTRPFYTLDIEAERVAVHLNTPSLQKRMIELHMGHGPSAYKTYQQFFALGMLFVMLSGLWLGLSSDRLRATTLLTSGSGLLLFVVLVLS
ncbi:MAG: hypothetical protein P8M73_09090 [Luminiphilus sp.]|jgi:hypothetical protein|nr:hypothetical protein [Luminiphilus sp.]